MKTKILRRVTACLMCAFLLLSAVGCAPQGKESALNPETPATVTIWNYYNGDQLEAFEKLVEDFNNSVGIEKGITVVSVSQGDINTLADSLIASANGDAGAQELPSLAAVYAETAYILDTHGALAELDSYFTADELAAYVTGFLEEGRFNATNKLSLFPLLKSTEVFSANKTDWAPFTEATGIELESITTKEQLTAAAKSYYEWTDSLTPDIAEDGKALYGRDSVSNYIYIGTYQLGHEMFKVKDGVLTVDLDRDTFKTLWDNYYIPFINGYFGAYAKFRSEDCKTGKILALTSSSSSVGYLPTAVTEQDDTSHDIETYFSSDLRFENSANNAIVQQGASYCMLKGTPAQQEGAVEFLKWCSASERNLQFALSSGYSPVTLAANNSEAIRNAYSGDTSMAKEQNVLNSLLICAEAFNTKPTYATKPFSGSKEARNILGTMFEEIAVNDRAAVVEAIAGGVTRKDAVAQYITDEYFDTFFTELSAQVNAAVGK